jgi:hypothetical protein
MVAEFEACQQQTCRACRASWRVPGVARDATTLCNYARFLHKIGALEQAELVFILSFVAGKAWGGSMQDEDDWECGGVVSQEAVAEAAQAGWRIGDETRARDAGALQAYGALLLDGMQVLRLTPPRPGACRPHGWNSVFALQRHRRACPVGLWGALWATAVRDDLQVLCVCVCLRLCLCLCVCLRTRMPVIAATGRRAFARQAAGRAGRGPAVERDGM